RQQLAKKLSYWDFTNLTSGYWKDNHFWAETSHFGTEVGGLMLDRIRGESPNSSFGVLVDSNNVDDFIKNQYQILSESYADIAAYDSNTYIHESYLHSWHSVDINNVDALTLAENEPAIMQIKLNVDEDT